MIYQSSIIVCPLDKLTKENLTTILAQLNKTIPVDMLKLQEIYDNLNKTLINLKNADLSFLEPLKNYIMSLNGTDMKEKQKEIINLINAINADVKNVLKHIDEITDNGKKEINLGNTNEDSDDDDVIEIKITPFLFVKVNVK